MNVGGVIAMTREAAAVMGSGGAIVNVSSIEGLQPAFDHSHYAAAKAAVIMHTRAAALELGPRDIRVNCVSPGLVESRRPRAGLAEGVARWHAAAPLRRLGGPADVADAPLPRLRRRPLDHGRQPRRRRRRPHPQHLVGWHRGVTW